MDKSPNQTIEQQQKVICRRRHTVLCHYAHFLNMENIIYSLGLYAPMVKREREREAPEWEMRSSTVKPPLLRSGERAAIRESN